MPQIPVFIKILNALGVTVNPATDETVALGDNISRVDQASATIIYIGRASPSASTSDAVWRISRVDTSVDLEVLFADGNGNYDNVWNDRASLSYS